MNEYNDLKKFFKVMYISDLPSPYFKKGEVYDAFYPVDNRSGEYFAFYIEEDDEPGNYAFPSSRFKIVEEQ